MASFNGLSVKGLSQSGQEPKVGSEPEKHVSSADTGVWGGLFGGFADRESGIPARRLIPFD
jgi:hypothetical protein